MEPTQFLGAPPAPDQASSLPPGAPSTPSYLKTLPELGRDCIGGADLAAEGQVAEAEREARGSLGQGISLPGAGPSNPSTALGPCGGSYSSFLSVPEEPPPNTTPWDHNLLPRRA